MQPRASRSGSDSPSSGTALDMTRSRAANTIVTAFLPDSTPDPTSSIASVSATTSGSARSLPRVPPIQTFSPRSPDSPVTYSPSIKRKPLPPSSALSPPSQTGYPGPLVSTGAERSILPQSSNVLNNILEAQSDRIGEPQDLDDREHTSYYFADSPVEITDRVAYEDFPKPPLSEPSPTLPNEGQSVTSKEKGMGLRPGERPAPLRMDSINSVKSMDSKKQALSPSTKFTSFFMRKPQASPGADSAVTEISDGRSPMPSPYLQSDTGSGMNNYFNFARTNTLGSHDSQDSFELPPPTRFSSDAKCNALEAELKEISIELANSIRRELDLEDIVDRLQSENPYPISRDRTSDYFSDSGTNSLQIDGSELTAKDELDKVKRDSEQQRAQLKVDLSHKWQEEAYQRKLLEAAFDDLRRKLHEERKSRTNFEELTLALRTELEQHKMQTETVKSSMTKLQLEIQHLKDENAALASAREMERGMNRGSMQFIAEEDDIIPGGGAAMGTSRLGSLSRSNTIGRNNRGSLARSGSLGRANSGPRGAPVAPESFENAVEKLKSVEQQRDALHVTVKYLLRRQDVSRKQATKRARMLEAELERTQNTSPQPRKSGYEREVRVLRSEINTLRKRADDALDQKWQCEKNLAGLKMDLDRNKQETAQLQRILQAKGSDPEIQGFMSATLESAIVELQKEKAQLQESSRKMHPEDKLSEQVEEYAARSEILSIQVKKQLENNASLRSRLKLAVENGEQTQLYSADQISELQIKLRKLEDAISGAQTTSETAVMKHEDEIRVLKASHNAQLMRALSTSKKPGAGLLTPAGKSPLSPMFANSKKSPRLDNTSTGPGMALHEALRTEYLEHKVSDLEKALAETENEIEKIVGKMNQAQMNVADLETERDEALRLTRQLETLVQEERKRYAHLVDTVNQW